MPSRNSIRPVMPCLSRNDAARLGVSLAGSTEMPTTLHVLAIDVVERALDRLHLRWTRVLARRVHERVDHGLALEVRRLVTVLPSWSVSVKSGTGWPGGRIAPAHPSALSSSPVGPVSSPREASVAPMTAATAHSVSATSARRRRAGSTAPRLERAPVRPSGPAARAPPAARRRRARTRSRVLVAAARPVRRGLRRRGRSGVRSSSCQTRVQRRRCRGRRSSTCGRRRRRRGRTRSGRAARRCRRPRARCRS